MPRIFLGNFNFEHELAGAASGGPQGSDFFWAWLPVAEAKDFIIAPGRIDPRDFTELANLGLAVPRFVHERPALESLRDIELVPWGWTKSIIAFGRSRDWDCAAPPLDVVRQVNSRAFRFALERDWDVGLPGAALVTSSAELDAVVQKHGNAPRGWLLKANFGMSGREALHGRGTTLDDKTRNWAQNRLTDIGPVVFEPIVERIAEAGIQIEIPQAGSPQLVGVTPLLVDRSGVYRGSRFGCPTSELEAWQPAVGVGLRVAQTLQHLGYFGPLGIDAMQYRDETGAIRLRPLQDLNARYTMGRLALGFCRLLRAGGCGSWLHFSRRHLAGRALDKWLGDLRRSLPAEITTAATSPRNIGSQPVEHHAVLLLGPTSEARPQAEAALFDSLGIAIGGGAD